jgi:hypothetical protein
MANPDKVFVLATLLRFSPKQMGDLSWKTAPSLVHTPHPQQVVSVKLFGKEGAMKSADELAKHYYDVLRSVRDLVLSMSDKDTVVKVIVGTHAAVVENLKDIFELSQQVLPERRDISFSQYLVELSEKFKEEGKKGG